MRNEPFVGLESVPMETRSRRSGPFHLDLYSARLLLGSTAKKSTADSFLSPSPRNSISAFFQRRISSSFLSLFSFFLPFLYFSPSISFLPSRTPSSPPFPSPPLEVSTGLWIFSGNVSNRFMVFSCILKIHQLYSLPIGTTPIVSSLRFHNSTRRLRSKCELVYFLSRSITSRLPFFLSLCLSLSLSSSSSFLLVFSYVSIELLIPPRSNVEITIPLSSSHYFAPIISDSYEIELALINRNICDFYLEILCNVNWIHSLD